MASSTYNTILVGVNGGERPVLEAKADEAITPGELVRFDSDEELEPHGTASGAAMALFALENPYAAAGSSAAIDTDYALGDYVRYVHAQPGDKIYAWLKAGETAVKGQSYLVSDGAGALLVKTMDATVIAHAAVAVAAEDKVAGGARARILVEVI